MIHRHMQCRHIHFCNQCSNCCWSNLLRPTHCCLNVYLGEGVNFVLSPSKRISSISSIAIFLGFKVVPSDRIALLITHQVLLLCQ